MCLTTSNFGELSIRGHLFAYSIRDSGSSLGTTWNVQEFSASSQLCDTIPFPSRAAIHKRLDGSEHCKDLIVKVTSPQTTGVISSRWGVLPPPLPPVGEKSWFRRGVIGASKYTLCRYYFFHTQLKNPKSKCNQRAQYFWPPRREGCTPPPPRRANPSVTSSSSG